MITITEQQAEAMANYVDSWTGKGSTDYAMRARWQVVWLLQNGLPSRVMDEAGFEYGLDV